MQKMLALSITESELMATVFYVHFMMYVRRVLISLELKVKFPMLLETDNKGTVDLINNWSIRGRTIYV